MRRRFLAAIVGAALCAALPASAKPAAQLADVPIQSLAIRVIDEDKKFMVVDSRMDETATAAVFLGMIGATVNSAVNASEDQKKAEPLLATAQATDVEALVREALVARLQSRNAIPLAADPAAASHTLVVDIGEWGLVRRGQKPDMLLRPFLKMSLRIVDARNREVWGPQREHTVGQRAALLFEWTPETFGPDMAALATAGGQQVANKLIYR